MQITVIFLLVIGFYLFSMFWTQKEMVGGFGNALSNMKVVAVKFFPPNLSVIPAIWPAMAQTIQMAIIATTISALLTIPLALMRAEEHTSELQSRARII